MRSDWGERMRSICVTCALAAALAAIGCGSDSRGMRIAFERDSGRHDAGPLTPGDSGPGPIDAGRDSGVIFLDAGFDAGRDAGRDSGPRDAGRDSGPRDAGRDSGPPPTGCALVGIACDPSTGCASGECQDRIDYTYGGTDDPITGHPMGSTTVESGYYFRDGYCTPSAINYVASGGCDPADDTSCGTCATCLSMGVNTTGELSMCLKNCTASLTTRTCPQTDQQCLLGSDVCIWGCVSDDECAIYRPDTNGNGTIDAYDPVTNPGGDRLTYDTTGGWTCNTTTRRCQHLAPAGANAGDACVRDSQCERYGRCLEAAIGWPGGYCIKNGCDVAGNACATGGVCDTRAFGTSVCLAPCTVAATATVGNVYSNARDCRTGYACFWDGVSGTTANNGVCIPGNYNAVRTANTGADCRDAFGEPDETRCHSPYGLGQCRDWDGPAGAAVPSCTFFDCGAPGVPSTVCGTGGVCASVTASVTTLCLETCTSASTCAPGHGCWDTTTAGIDTGGLRVCFSGCMSSTDCRVGETCIGGSATTLGECG